MLIVTVVLDVIMQAFCKIGECQLGNYLAGMTHHCKVHKAVAVPVSLPCCWRWATACGLRCNIVGASLGDDVCLLRHTDNTSKISAELLVLGQRCVTVHSEYVIAKHAKHCWVASPQQDT